MRRLLLLIIVLSFCLCEAKAQPVTTTQCVTTAVAGGTGDAITIPTLPCIPTTTLLILSVTTANATTAPTIQSPSGPILPVVNYDGKPLLPGQLVAGSRVLLTSSGQKWYTLAPAVTALTDFTHLNISPADQSITNMPLGNPVSTISSFIVGGTTPASPNRQYLTQMNLVSTSGLGQGNTGAGDVAALYMAIEAAAGSGNTWAFNPLVQIDPGSGAGGHHQVSELDMNNNKAAVDPALGPAGTQFPGPTNTGSLYAYGNIVECSGAFRCSAAMLVAGANYWHRGYVCFNSVDYSCFADYTSSAIVLDVWGTHVNVIDISNATSVANVLANVNKFELTAVGNLILFSSAHIGDAILEIGGDTVNGRIQLGSLGLANSPYIDFHSNGTVAPDFRLQSVGNVLAVLTNSGSTTELKINSSSGGIAVGTANTPIANGDVNASSYHVASVAGVSCAAGTVNLTTFVITNGIPTHC